MSIIDLNRLPSDSWDRRAALLLHDIELRAEQTLTFLRDDYSQWADLELCRRFIFSDLNDAPRSDCSSLGRVWFFPWVEIQNELSEALNHLMMSAYKAPFDNYRRALELAVLGAYFVQEHVSEDEGKLWLRSERESPLFSRTLAKLLVNHRFAAVNSAVAWADELRAFYWRLCDIVHVRGERAGARQLQPSHLYVDDASSREFSATRLRVLADTFIDVVRHVATIVALENPILLFGFDLESKFGLNPPLSGYFEESQVARLRTLLLPSVALRLVELADRDEEVQSFREWFHGIPDITDELVAKQARDLRELLKADDNRDDSNG